MITGEKRIFEIEKSKKGENYAKSISKRLHRLGYAVRTRTLDDCIIVEGLYHFDIFFKDEE